MLRVMWYLDNPSFRTLSGLKSHQADPYTLHPCCHKWGSNQNLPYFRKHLWEWGKWNANTCDPDDKVLGIFAHVPLGRSLHNLMSSNHDVPNSNHLNKQKSKRKLLWKNKMAFVKEEFEKQCVFKENYIYSRKKQGLFFDFTNRIFFKPPKRGEPMTGKVVFPCK